MMDLKTIGARCKEYRLTLGVLQYKVAQDTGYSLENISSFETGRNDNARILLWYLKAGMPLDYLLSENNNRENISDYLIYGGINNGAHI